MFSGVQQGKKKNENRPRRRNNRVSEEREEEGIEATFKPPAPPFSSFIFGSGIKRERE